MERGTLRQQAATMAVDGIEGAPSLSRVLCETEPALSEAEGVGILTSYGFRADATRGIPCKSFVI